MEASEPVKTLVKRSGTLGHRLASLRRSLVTVEFSRRLAITLAAALLLLGGLMLVDWLVELSLENRRALLAGAAIATGLLVLWTLSSLRTQRRSDEQIALMVEREHPEFDSRLIGSVQFSEGKAAIPADAPVEMVKAMVAETEQAARGRRFKDIVDPRKLARAALLLLAVATVAVIGAIIARDMLPTMLARAFGGDRAIPRDTRILEAPAAMKIGIGDRLELGFLAEGVLPAEGRIAIAYESGRRETAALQAVPGVAGRYVIAMEDVPESFTFRATINDASTAKVRVTALERPSLESVVASQTYPKFTGLAPTKHAPGDFALFPGSTVELAVTASKPLDTAILTLIGSGEEIALEVDKADPLRARSSITVPAGELSGFTFALRDTEEMDSVEDTIYRVSLLADRAPEIRITYPRRAEELVTRKARLLVRYEATDRFGIANIALRFRRGQEEPGTLPIELTEQSPKALEGAIEWKLAELQPSPVEGDIIEYRLEATDQNGNLGSSEHLLAEVVTPEEKRADLLGRASDALGGVGEATTDQERLNQDLKTLIEENNR